jgi:pseudaminic acid cytidylyltransferase
MIAIVPARGGSKRIPRKNIRPFFGLPILAHTLTEIRKTGLFSAIIVSTEDEEISQIAISAGAHVVFRDEILADDFTSTVDVIAAAIEQLSKTMKLQEEIVCCIYPITPKIKKEYLLKALQMIGLEELDYVFTAKQFQSSPGRSFRKRHDGKPEMCFPDNLNTRTQDLPEFFHDAALFYLGKSQAWVEKRPILTGNSKFIEVGKYDAYDVDDEQDWDFMEKLYEVNRKTQEDFE